MNILINVRNKIATAPDDAKIVCGNSDYTLTFDFDSEWDSEAEKTARFIWTSGKRTKYTDTCFTGNTVAVPILRNTHSLRVGVYAGDLHTTSPAKISCLPSILCPDGIEDSSTPMVWTILQKRLDAIEKYLGECGGDIRVANIELLSAKWVGEESPYSQVVAIDGITEYSQVDLTPSVEQLVIFYQKDLTFVTENDSGRVTVYAIGQKPGNDYTIQATIKEVTT